MLLKMLNLVYHIFNDHNITIFNVKCTDKSTNSAQFHTLIQNYDNLI
jgi:hypothetical protein